MLCKFRRIARARSEETLKNALNDLRSCDYWKGGYENLVNQFEKQWISLIKVYQTDTLVAYTKDVIYTIHIDLYFIYKSIYKLYYLYKLRFI